MLDVLVSHVMLNGPGVLPIISQFVSSRMSEHVRVHREANFGKGNA